MKRRLLSIFLLLFSFSFNIIAQEVFWASKVLEFSSENIVPFQPSANRTSQILGKPDVLPQFVASGLAWQPAFKKVGNQEFIKVSFDTLIAIKQISIAKNFGEGIIEKIIAYDESRKNHLIYQSTDSLISVEKGEMFNVILTEKTPYKVFAIGIFIINKQIDEILQIDAVGISTFDSPIQANINIAKNAPDEVIKQNLGKNINTRHQEFAPIISRDGKTLFFTRNYINLLGKAKDQDVWLSKQNEKQQWTKAQNIGLPINTKDKNAVFAISNDGTEVYLMNKYHKNGKLSSGISHSIKSAGVWSFPEEVKIENYYNQSPNAEFALSPDGNIMIMSIQRKNTTGKRDLYVSFKRNDIWTEPKNLGKKINTIEHEMTPFLAADTKTLYFSTRGFPGFGDNDIFKSQRLDDTWTKWTEPENLGPAINTPQWDGYFTLPASGEYAYICSYNGNTNKEDIFKLILPKSARPEPVIMIMGDVLNTTEQEPIACKILTTLRKSNLKEERIYEPSNGKFNFVFPLGEIIEIEPVAQGYLAMTETLDFSTEKKYREITLNLHLIPLEVGNKGLLNSLTFSQGEAKLQSAAFKDLDRIIQAMYDFPTLEILFEGHTDNQGDAELNLKLSEDRVSIVKKYMISKGIAANRIKTKGWGQTRPIASNSTEDKRKLNRRVEFTIIKK